jgi:hypothetical protein
MNHLPKNTHPLGDQPGDLATIATILLRLLGFLAWQFLL